MTDSLKWSRKENHGWLKTLANQTSLKWLRKENHGWLKTLANQKLEELLDLIFKPGIVWFNEVMFGTVKGERLSRLVVAEGFKLFRLVGAAGFKYQDDRRSLLEPIKIHFNIHETTIHSGVDSIVPDGVNTLVRTALDSVFTLREEPPYREQYDGMFDGPRQVHARKPQHPWRQRGRSVRSTHDEPAVAYRKPIHLQRTPTRACSQREQDGQTDSTDDQERSSKTSVQE